jgi:hypothetical protein
MAGPYWRRFKALAASQLRPYFRWSRGALNGAVFASAVIAASVVQPAARPAMAQPVVLPQRNIGALFWSDGGEFKQFGPNEVVSIGTGLIQFIGFGLCTTGIDDQIVPAADIYIMPSGSVPGIGGKLADVRGTVHPVVGNPLVNEVIGTTAPGGTLAPGKYAVIYNECQDGTRAGWDEVFDPAFEVVIPANIPPLPPASFAGMKQNAREDAARIGVIAPQFMNNMLLLKAWAAIGGGGAGASKVAADPTGMVIDMIEQTISKLTGSDPEGAAITWLTNDLLHYQAIADDPPDPNFKQSTPLGAREQVDLHSDEPLVNALANVGTNYSTEAALTQALIT